MKTKKIVLLLTLIVTNNTYSMKIQDESTDLFPQKINDSAFNINVVKTVQEDIIAEVIETKIDNDLNQEKTKKEETHEIYPIQKDLSLIEYSTSTLNSITVGESFTVRVNGSIGQDVKLVFDKNGYFSKGIKNNSPKNKLGASVFVHYTALKPGRVKVTSQNMFRGTKQGQPDTYTFNIIEKNSIASSKKLSNKIENNTNTHKEEIFSDSIGFTVEASEERVNKNNLSGVVNDTDDMIETIDNHDDKNLKIIKISFIKNNIIPIAKRSLT